MAIETETLLALTADIVAAHVTNNRVGTGDVADLIRKVHGALQSIDVPQAGEVTPAKPTGAVSVRSSIKPQHIVSMIDGKPYKMLKRHLSLNGYTPESYREAFGLAKDYPMVASDYAEKRRALAHKIGLGRKRKIAEAVTANEPAAKPVRKPRAKKEAAP